MERDLLILQIPRLNLAAFMCRSRTTRPTSRVFGFVALSGETATAS